MPTPPKLLEILRHKQLPFHQIECQCTKDHLIEIATKLTGWENVAGFLGLDETHEEEIRGRYPGKTRKQTEAMLLMWREEFGQKATYEVLMKAFLKVGKTSLVETTCDIFKADRPSVIHEDIPPVASASQDHTPPPTDRLNMQQLAAGASPTPQSSTAAHDIHQLLPAIDGSVLIEDDLGDVWEAVIDLAGRWTSMCTALRLKASAEDTISHKYHNPDECLKAVLRQWLRKDYDTKKHGLPTWRKLVEAVAKPAGGNNPDLAKELAGKHQVENIHLVKPIHSHLQPAGQMAYGSPQEMAPRGGASQYPPPGSQPQSYPHHSVPQWQGQPQTFPPPAGYQMPLTHTQPPPQHYGTGNQFAQGAQGPAGYHQPPSKSVQYMKVYSKFDVIVDHLATTASPGTLADKLWVAELIGEDIRDKASVMGMTDKEKMRPMIKAVLAKIEIDVENYTKFLMTLKGLGAMDDLISLIEKS